MQSETAQTPWIYNLLAWLDTHKKQTIQAVGVVVVFVIIVSYYFYSRAQKEEAAAAGFSRLLLTRSTPDEFLKFQADNSGTQAGSKALLIVAQLNFSEGKFADSQAQFQKLRQEYRNSPFSSIASLGIASCLDAQGKVDEAISAYSELAHHNDLASLQAEFSLGRLYETKGQLDKAVENYDDVVHAGGNSSFADEAYVRAGVLRAQHPTLAKAAPAISLSPGQDLPPAK